MSQTDPKRTFWLCIGARDYIQRLRAMVTVRRAKLVLSSVCTENFIRID
jgi:hypothetical protein